ncbi:MAG: GNAT family N-acetyltransferase [Cyanobacteria bacterium J06560_5]
MNSKTNDVLIRQATTQDEPTLWTALIYASHESDLSSVKENPELSRYVEGFGRTGDLGMVAEQNGQPIGAAWVRLWQAGNRGYGYVADDIPELSIAVLPDHRAKGIGTKLLQALFAEANHQFPAISLSTQSDNPAFHLYQRLGFVPFPGSKVINRRGAYSLNMVREL